MSYDIFVQDMPTGVRSIDEIPGDFVPSSLGPRQQIIDGIIEVIHTADFSDPTWGKIDCDDWSIEVNIGEKDPCDSFAFHVRGGVGALGAVAAILDRLRMRAFDASEGGIFSASKASIESFDRWLDYRDQVASKGD